MEKDKQTAQKKPVSQRKSYGLTIEISVARDRRNAWSTELVYKSRTAPWLEPISMIQGPFLNKKEALINGYSQAAAFLRELINLRGTCSELYREVK